MTIDLTRRTLLHLAGASSLSAAAIAAAQAEGMAGGGPTFANRTPMRIGMVTLRVRDLDKVADYYRDAIGLTVMQRSATVANLGKAFRRGGRDWTSPDRISSSPETDAHGFHPWASTLAPRAVPTEPRYWASRRTALR